MNKNYDYVLQQNSYDCGVASIMSILMYYGIKPSRENIVNSISKKYGGYAAYDLIEISKKYGIEAYGVKSDIRDIKKFPVIAHTIKDKNMFHFIVIYEMHKDYIKILDPSFGIKNISYEEFNEITTNIFLIFMGWKKKKVSNKKFINELIKIIKVHKKVILVTLFLSFMFVILSLIFNYYLKLILTYASSSKIILFISLEFLFISIIKSIINFFKNKLILSMNLKIDKDLTSNIINHIFNLPYEYFIQKTTGELVTVLEDVENFKEIVTKIFILSIVDFLLVIIVIIYTLILNVYVGIILIILLIIFLFITKKYQYIFNDSYLSYRNSKISYTSMLINYITSFETIKNLNITPNVLKKINKKYKNLNSENIKYEKNFYKYNFITSSITDIFYIFVIFITTYISINNGVDILDVVLFSSIFYMIIDLITNINESISLYKVYQTSTDRVLELLDVPVEDFSNTNFSLINQIVFKNICYEKDDSVILKDINLKIEKGDKIFLTGKSGIGKSTLMKLLLKYYEVSKGNIYIDNIDINEFDLSFIRDNITYIGQNEELWNDTILGNFKVVSEDFEKIKELSKLTLLDKTFENNNIDYNYIIEESGSNLSGGERKKIILTRGLLKFKNVLILDEVFNEISLNEEKEILENLFLKYPDKIIIMISHRDNNSNLFDKKYVIKGDEGLVEIK